MSRRVAGLAVALTASLGFAPPAAEAQNFTEVSCGQVITESIDVVNDLEGCAGDRLVGGGRRDHGGPEGSTASRAGWARTACEGDWRGRYGRSTRQAIDGLTIKNGAIGTAGEPSICMTPPTAC